MSPATSERSTHLAPFKWKPGESGNPNGKQSGIVSLIAKETQNGQELVTFLLDVFRNGKRKEQIEACNALLDRYFGKPAQTTLVGTTTAMGAMSLDELIAYREDIRLEREALTQAALPATTTAEPEGEASEAGG